jgi:hypothetical protein
LQALFQDLKLQSLEMDDHTWIVQLKLDHALLQALDLWEMLGEFTGELGVDE